MGFRLGPVLGLITNNTARIMIETSSTGKYIFRYAKEDGDEWKYYEYEIKAGKPTVFQIKNLETDSVYEFNVTDFDNDITIKGAFKTLNCYFKMIYPDPVKGDLKIEETTFINEINIINNTSEEMELSKIPNMAFVSCNDYREKDHVWNKVAYEKHFYTFHIGDQVYTDRVVKRVDKILKETPKENWPEEKEFVKELFREIYRKTWNGTSKNALSLFSNIMIGDDKEIYVKGGKRKKDRLNFIRQCSYEVYGEYQRSLRLNPTKIDARDYFIMQVGDVGFFILDTYMRNFLPGKEKEYLGREQLDFFQRNMKTFDVDRWVVITTQPIFQSSSCFKSFYDDISEKHNELTDGFNKKEYRKELEEFLSYFENYSYEGHELKKKLPLFVSGDTHVASLFVLKKKGMTEGYQVISSGVQKVLNKKDYRGYKMISSFSGKTDSIQGYHYKLDWSKRECNFLKLEFFTDDIKICHITETGDFTVIY